MEAEAPQELPTYTHLMLSGGGYLGYVYIGVYRFLKEHNMLHTIKYLYGTSIGSIFAFLFGLDIPYECMEELFMPGGLLADKSTHTYDPANIITLPKDFGIFSTRRISHALRAVLQEFSDCTDITFREYLKKTGKDLHVNATCLEDNASIDFCNETHPDMSVLLAIEASSAIPFIFKPITLAGKHYIDGATMNNLPLHYVPDKIGTKCLAFKIEMVSKCTKISSLLEYAMQIFCTVTNASYCLEIQHSKADIVSMYNIPLPACPMYVTETDKYHVYYSKEEIDKAIYYAYETTYKFFFKNSISASTVLSPSNTIDLPPTSSST